MFKPLESMERLGLPAGFKVLDIWEGEKFTNEEEDAPPTGKTTVKTNKKFKED